MMYEQLSNLTIEQQKELLANLIEDDVSYWKKVLLLMAMVNESEDTELLDLVIEHKIEEINLTNKKYNLSLKYNGINDANQKEKISLEEEKADKSNNTRNNKVSRVCAEVLEIIKFIPEEYYKRINKKIIEKFERNADKSYRLSIAPDTSYSDLDVLNETREIISLLGSKFWNIDGKIIDIAEIFNK